MRWSNSYRAKLLFIGVVLYSTLSLPKLLDGHASEALNASQEPSEVVIMIASHDHRYQPRPDLGFVVLVEDDSDVIVSIHRELSLFTQNKIIAVGGRDRRGLWIVESRQSAAQNEDAIKTLSAQKQVRYVAPLFSCNGEWEAIIPEIVVRVTAGTKQEELEQICQRLNLHIKRRMMYTEQEYLVDVLGENAEAVFTGLIELNQIDSVEWAAPNVITRRKRPEAPVSENNSQGDISLFNAPQTPRTTGLLPNDEYFPMQWHLHNTGQFGGTPDADINALEAWEITAGDPNIVVVVHDVGVELNHPDLVNNIVQGYDVYDDDYIPDTSGDPHGTECAGVIAAEGNNSIGVVGVAHNCKIMPIRDGTGSSYTSFAESAEAVRWSAVNGADVLSNSWGVNSRQPIFHSAVIDVTKPGGIGRDGKGCVVFASAGNQGSVIQYPAANPEVIAVGATDCHDVLWSYSNYGPALDIVAPGGERWYYAPNGKEWPLEGNGIWTTDITGPRGVSSDPKNPFPDIEDYALFGGTSSSCPVAAGVAALILSLEPDLTNDEVRHFLERSAKDLGDPGRDDYYGWGRVDARAALDMVLAKRADLNNDWKVDFEDLLILIELWGTTESSADIAPTTKRDGIVDEQDLELMMQYWQIEIPEFGLVAHWELDETEGNVAYDSARIAGCDGTLVGGPVWQPDGGMVDGALQLDGIDDYVSTDPVLNPVDGSFSVFTWIKGGAPGQAIISQTDRVDWLLADASGGNLMTELKGSGRGAAALLSETGITDGNWHRVGFVWDGSNRTLYVDDVEVARDAQTDIASSEGGLYIGAGQTLNAVSFFSGLIDDVRIYDRAVIP